MKNQIIRIFYISGLLAFPINPDKWSSSVCSLVRTCDWRDGMLGYWTPKQMGRNYWKVSFPVRYYVWMQTRCAMCDLGRSSMAQSVRHRPLNAADRVRSQSMFDLWWTMWQFDKVAPQYFYFSRQYQFTTAPPWYTRLSWVLYNLSSWQCC